MAKVIQINQTDIERLRFALRQDPDHLNNHRFKDKDPQLVNDIFRMFNYQVERWINEVTNDV